MNADTLLENFEIFADAPGGISLLRVVIFELAISGRLLSQNPEEGDSEDLVEQLLHTRESRLREKLLPIRDIQIVGDHEYPFNVPKSWRWSRLGAICYPQAGFAFNSNEFNTGGKGMPLIRIRDISSDHTQCHYSGEYRDEFKVHRGDWLIGMDGNFNIRMWRGADGLLNQRVTRLLFLDEQISKRFVVWSLQHQISALMGTKSYTTVDHLSTKQIFEALIPLPPIPEQKRIVAKVDELMELCDHLEHKNQNRDNLRISTRKSAIDAVLTATTTEELETAWKRINNNWEVIVDTPESVGLVRSLILDLAVRGRLQNEADQEFDEVSGLPITWILHRLDQVCSYVQRGKGPKYADLSNYVVVSQKCVQWTGFDISKARFVDEESLNSYSEERFLRNGDILWNSTGTGTVGRTAIYHDSSLFKKVVADSHVTVLRAPGMNPQFLWSWTASPAVQSMIANLTSGTTNQQELNLSSIKSLLVPVPPLPEQNRIVAKVEELMMICDQLEDELTVRRDVAEKFSRSVVSVSGSTEFEI
jgi:type I restriction enzyme S subunit